MGPDDFSRFKHLSPPLNYIQNKKYGQNFLLELIETWISAVARRLQHLLGKSAALWAVRREKKRPSIIFKAEEEKKKSG